MDKLMLLAATGRYRRAGPAAKWWPILHQGFANMERRQSLPPSYHHTTLYWQFVKFNRQCLSIYSIVLQDHLTIQFLLNLLIRMLVLHRLLCIPLALVNRLLYKLISSSVSGCFNGLLSSCPSPWGVVHFSEGFSLCIWLCKSTI